MVDIKEIESQFYKGKQALVEIAFDDSLITVNSTIKDLPFLMDIQKYIKKVNFYSI